MILIPVTVNYTVDEVVQVGFLNGKYALFENNVYVQDITPDEAAEKYIACGARVPDEFQSIREAVGLKIQRLQAIL